MPILSQQNEIEKEILHINREKEIKSSTTTIWRPFSSIGRRGDSTTVSSWSRKATLRLSTPTVVTTSSGTHPLPRTRCGLRWRPQYVYIHDSLNLLCWGSTPPRYFCDQHQRRPCSRRGSLYRLRRCRLSPMPETCLQQILNSLFLRSTTAFSMLRTTSTPLAKCQGISSYSHANVLMSSLCRTIVNTAGNKRSS